MTDHDPPSITPDIKEASNFLATFGENHSFQVLPESGKSAPVMQHGTFTKMSGWLISKNRQGNGVFFMVNRGDGRGRKAENVKAISSYFIDLDGAPYESALVAPLEPSIITESSPGRYHAYWLIDGAPLDTFTSIQKSLAQQFKSDPAINDLPRIMRIPGFFHLKKNPFKSTVLQNSKTRYKYNEFISKFGIDPNSQPRLPALRTNPNEEPIFDGQRNVTLLSICGTLRNRGLTGEALKQALMAINVSRCVPPLEEKRIRTMADSISKKPLNPQYAPQNNYNASNQYYQGNSNNRYYNERKEDVKAPTIITFAQLQETKYKPIQWIAKGLLPEGLTILAGKPKLGKSWLSLSISLAIARGVDSLQFFKSNPGSVLSLSMEDTERRLQYRTGIVLGKEPFPEQGCLSCKWPRLPQGIDYMKKWLDEQKNPRLIVIDTLAKIRQQSTGFKSSGTLYDKDYNNIEQLQQLAADYQIAIICVTHKNKSDHEDDYDSVTGSAAVTGVSDSIWIFNRKTRSSPNATLNISGRDIADATYTLTWDNSAASWYYEPQEDQNVDKAQDRILKILLKHDKPLTATEIAHELNVSRGYTHKVLNELITTRKIQKTNTTGQYFLSNLSMLDQM